MTCQPWGPPGSPSTTTLSTSTSALYGAPDTTPLPPAPSPSYAALVRKPPWYLRRMVSEVAPGLPAPPVAAWGTSQASQQSLRGEDREEGVVVVGAPETAVQECAPLVGEAAAVVQIQVAVRGAAGVQRHHLRPPPPPLATAALPDLPRSSSPAQRQNSVRRNHQGK